MICNKGDYILFLSLLVHLIVDVLKNHFTGYPLHRENRENGKRNSLSGKTQGIWFGQVVNSLILKVKEICSEIL